MVAQLHRSTLGPISRAYYDEILNALATFSDEAKLPGGLDHTAAFEVFRLVLHDNPRIIWSSSSATTAESGSRGVTRMSFSYLRGEAEARAELDAIALSADPILELAADMPAGLTRVTAIHDGLLGLGAGVEGGADLRNALGALGRGHAGAVCTGYARAFKLLCDAARVPCAVVSGWSSDGDLPPKLGRDGDTNHAWNLVDVSGEKGAPPRWVHVDAYWDAGHDDWPFHHAYLGLSDDEASKNHLCAGVGFCPTCGVSAGYYEASGLEARSVGEAEEMLRYARGDAAVEMRLPLGDEEEFRRVAHEVTALATRVWRSDVSSRLMPERRVLLCRKRRAGGNPASPRGLARLGGKRTLLAMPSWLR